MMTTVIIMMTIMTWPDDHGYVYDDNDDTEMTMMTWPRSAAFLNFAYLFGSKSSPTYDRTINHDHHNHDYDDDHKHHYHDNRHDNHKNHHDHQNPIC